jgi:hypothetical protein
VTAIASVYAILRFQLHGRGVLGFLHDLVAAGRSVGTSFGLGSWTLLAALVSVARLLVISTDGAIRKLKARC